MFSTPSHRQALLASLCLTVFLQQPVVPADVSKILAAGLGGPPVVARTMESTYTALGTVCETGTVYDADEKIWKRWYVEAAQKDGQTQSLLRLALSQDGTTWQTAPGVCYELSDMSCPEGEFNAPVVVQNEEGPRGRKFMLWYGTDSADQSGAHSIKMAYSADGRQFTVTPVTVHVVGKSTPAPILVDRLKELANAYSDAAL